MINHSSSNQTSKCFLPPCKSRHSRPGVNDGEAYTRNSTETVYPCDFLLRAPRVSPSSQPILAHTQFRRIVTLCCVVLSQLSYVFFSPSAQSQKPVAAEANFERQNFSRGQKMLLARYRATINGNLQCCQTQHKVISNSGMSNMLKSGNTE